MRDLLAQSNIRKILRYALFLFLTLVVQNMLFTQIRPMGVCPMVVPAVVVAIAMFESVNFSFICALILGIFMDMAFAETTVLFTILFPALAFGAGFVSQFFINRRFFAFMGLALAAELITALVQMLLTWAGDVWSNELIRTALLQTLWSMPPAALAFFPPARWIGKK